MQTNLSWLMLMASLYVSHIQAAPLHELKLPPEQPQRSASRVPVEFGRTQQDSAKQKKLNQEFEQNNKEIQKLLDELANQ